MAVRTVHRHVTQARHVAAGAVGLAAHVAHHFERRNRHLEIPAEETPDVVRLQRHLAEALRAAADQAEQADFAYERQKGHTRALRRLRDAGARELYQRLVRLRKALTGSFPDATATRILGVSGKTPREAVALANVGRTMLRRLLDETIELSEALPRGVSLDRRALAAAFEEQVMALEQGLDAVRDAIADETVLLVARDEALALLREVKTGAARMLEGLYLAAGLPHLVPGIRHRRTIAPHRAARRKRCQATVPHRSDAEALHETTCAHRVPLASEEPSAFPPPLFGHEERGPGGEEGIGRGNRWDKADGLGSSRRPDLPHHLLQQVEPAGDLRFGRPEGEAEALVEAAEARGAAAAGVDVEEDAGDRDHPVFERPAEEGHAVRQRLGEVLERDEGVEGAVRVAVEAEPDDLTSMLAGWVLVEGLRARRVELLAFVEVLLSFFRELALPWLDLTAQRQS